MKIEIFKNEKAKVEQDLKSIKRKSDLISWIRVALFILMVVFLTYGYFNKNNKFYAFSTNICFSIFNSCKIPQQYRS